MKLKLSKSQTLPDFMAIWVNPHKAPFITETDFVKQIGQLEILWTFILREKSWSYESCEYCDKKRSKSLKPPGNLNLM